MDCAHERLAFNSTGSSLPTVEAGDPPLHLILAAVRDPKCSGDAGTILIYRLVCLRLPPPQPAGAVPSLQQRQRD